MKLSEGNDALDNYRSNKANYQTDLTELKEKVEFFENQLDQKQKALKLFLEQNMDYFNTLKNMEDSYPNKLKTLQYKDDLIKDSMKEFQRLKVNSLSELEQREEEINKREMQLKSLQVQISNK